MNEEEKFIYIKYLVLFLIREIKARDLDVAKYLFDNIDFDDKNNAVIYRNNRITIIFTMDVCIDAT